MGPAARSHTSFNMQLSKSLLSTLAVAALAYADCSSLGGSDSFPGSFTLGAYDATAGTTTTLTLANSLTVPMTAFYILSVRCVLYQLSSDFR